MHTIRIIYMIFEISCSFFKKKNLNFHFFKTVIYGYFWFLAKNTPKLQKLIIKWSKSSICLIMFNISSKKSSFDVNLFSRTFDMKSPYCDVKWAQILGYMGRYHPLLGDIGRHRGHIGRYRGNIGRYHQISGDIGQYMAISGNIWRYQTILGGIRKYWGNFY